MLQRHAGDSYGYRFEAQGKALVYTHRFRAPARRPGGDRALRRVLPRRRPGDLRRHVFARRRHLGQGRLGPLEQRRRRRAVPAGGRAPPVPVPPRAGVRRRGDRRPCWPRRGGSRRSRAPARRCASAPPTTGWKSACEPRRAPAHPAGLRRAARCCWPRWSLGCTARLDRTTAGGLVRRAPDAVRRARWQTLPVTVVEIDQKSLVALGQWPWPRTLLAQLVRIDPARRAGGHRRRHPDAGGRRAVARAPAGAAHVRRPDAGRRRCAALPVATTRVLARALAGRPPCWSSPAPPSRRGMPLRAAPVTRARQRATTPTLPRQSRRRADQHRRARPRRRRPRPDLGRPVARRDPPHAARRQRRRHAGADARDRDAARRAARAVAAPGHVAAARSTASRRPAARSRPKPTARCASTSRATGAALRLGGRRARGPRRPEATCAASWC